MKLAPSWAPSQRSRSRQKVTKQTISSRTSASTQCRPMRTRLRRPSATTKAKEFKIKLTRRILSDLISPSKEPKATMATAWPSDRLTATTTAQTSLKWSRPQVACQKFHSVPKCACAATTPRWHREHWVSTITNLLGKHPQLWNEHLLN